MTLPEPTLFAAFLLAALVICVTPGPDMAYVMSFGLARGWRGGIAAASGIALGMLAGAGLAAFGSGALVRDHPGLLLGLKVVGIGYLGYLGVGFVRDRSTLTVSASRRGWTVRRIVLRAMLVNLTNPKVLLFFVAFLPQFTSASTGPVRPQILLLGVVFVGMGFLTDATVGLASGRLSATIAGRPEQARRLNVAAGCVMFGLAILVATTS